MATMLDTDPRPDTQEETPALVGGEVAPLAPERPREQTARMATEAVRAVQRARGGWRWTLRSWWKGLLGLFGR